MSSTKRLLDVKPCKRINTGDTGWLLEVMNRLDGWSNRSVPGSMFSQIYMAVVSPGKIKGWHKHKIKMDHFTCVQGVAQLAVIDKEGNFDTIVFGDGNYVTVRVRPGLWHAIKGLSPCEAKIINYPSTPYSPTDPDQEDSRVAPLIMSDFPWIKGTLTSAEGWEKLV